uniref:Complex I assembly factor TIMMDC1, mitochondrial n=1 Tax=Jaculus jaculus TaxID=51337 RepID=A0A8C5L9G0_JACJA
MDAPPAAPRRILGRALAPFPRVWAAESGALLETPKRPPNEPESGWARLRELFVKQSAHRAATRGFIRYGWRWSWRTGLFVTIFNTVNTGLTVYRNKSSLSHFVIAGAVTGGLFRINLGLRGLVAGGILGTLLGLPMGSLLMALQKYHGETVQERKEKDRKALHELKLEEWKTRLKVTELLPEEIESSLQKNQPEDDVKKIETLLSLPRNPSSSAEQNKD